MRSRCCNANDTLVFPIRAFSNGVSPNPPLACWRNIPKLMDDLASHTGGQRFDLSDNAADLVAAIEFVITANCGVQTQVTSVGECQVSPGLQEREVCFSFTGLVSDDDGIFTYDVAWGDGNSQSATTTSPYAACHIYTVPNDPGQTQDYTVAVGLTGQVGATSCPIENSKVISLNGCEPLAVTLASFDATPQADHVLVTWQTVSELDNAGFNLYRTVTSDPPTAANLLATIPSQGPGSTQGFFYVYQDYAVTAGEAYWYWLEDVDFNGATALHGPVSVVFAGPTAVTVSALEATPDQPVRSAWPLVLLMAAAALALAGAAGVRRTNA